jgi:hypothetical protein
MMVIMAMVVMIVAMAMVMGMMVMGAGSRVSGRQAKLTHLTVHLHLAQVGFHLPIAQHLE